ncbi:IclR family transcriptional regulator [Agrobacterium sp. MS2]|uniref:IclR family transcriptional regulator n=1 Tax=Agrobacterium sp. MS2 TaxID=1345498 RepID=UPI001877F922|nr:IclR family transcriptional regulator [Agrobacterium sp. MS2]
MNDHDNTEKALSAAPPPAILRGGQILRLLQSRNGNPMKATDIAKEIDVPRSSAVNICVALEQIGFLRSTPIGYQLGSALGELGQAFFRTFTPVRNFSEHCQRLGPLPMTVQLGMLENFNVVYLARQDGTNLISIASRVGGRLPANCTALGKAMLSTLNKEQLAQLLATQSEPFTQLTDRSVSTSDALLSILDDVRQTGFAIDDEETTRGILCVAVPLSRNQDISSAYSVSASILKSEATEPVVKNTISILNSLAKASSGSFEAN